MNIKTIYKENLVLLDCISGSTAYGLALPSSDIDKRGVFHLPKSIFYGVGGVDQVSNSTNDESYSELGRFFELLLKSNPTMIELLNTPIDFVIHQHPFFEKITPELYLSKKCKDTFAGYAITQIKKARGLKKKILNPVEKKRKSLLDFCYVPQQQGAVPVLEYLQTLGISQSQCGLAKIPHMNEMYGLYYDENMSFKGIVKKENANEVVLSEVPKNVNPITIMSCNASGYSTYCKEYKTYWQWVEKRNEERYENTLSHGKNYDAKNMMHTFRLLTMAEEIAKEGKVFVQRNDREFLLKIRAGEYEYDTLLKMAEEKIISMQEAYQTSNLPEDVNQEKLVDLLVELREIVYQ